MRPGDRVAKAEVKGRLGDLYFCHLQDDLLEGALPESEWPCLSMG